MAKPEDEKCEKVCISIPRPIYRMLKASFPHREFSPLLLQLVEYAIAANFMVRLQDIEPLKGSEHGEQPVLYANAAQIAFAEHAHRYLCRATASTASESLRDYLRATRKELDSGVMTVEDLDQLVDSAIEQGWDKKSQDPAPIPKEGAGRKPPKAKAPSAVPPVATIVEEFGADVEEFGS